MIVQAHLLTNFTCHFDHLVVLIKILSMSFAVQFQEPILNTPFGPLLLSMTTIADLNDKWAAYAGPGGWNGKNVILEIRFSGGAVITASSLNKF